MNARQSTQWFRRVVAVVGVMALAATGLAGTANAEPLQAAAAAADAPPPTVTADALPSWQINGVVWSQAIIGDTVYVTGSFTRARPPGVAAGGPGEVAANNIFAYRLSTGARVTTFATSPGLNAQGLVIRASADGSRLYVGGDFTTAAGAARGHIAAINPANGSAVAGFSPNVGGQVRGLGITSTTVFTGGNFMSANGVNRTRLAAFQTSNGTMMSWAPAAEGGYVWAMTMSPDLSRVIPAGSFTTLSGQPAYGMGSLMASDATVNPWPAQEKIRAAGSKGAITSIKADGTQVYGTSYAFGAGASYEGTFALDPTSGQIRWQNDCLGDTYDIAPSGPVLYNVSHQHDCTVIDGWPDTNPRVRWQKAGASYSYATTDIPATDIQTKNDAYGWAGSYGLLGLPFAKPLHWYPNFAFGSYTSSRQAGWAIDTSADGQWVVVGGEFPRVNGVAQQGITRFRTAAGAPKKVGPSYSTVPATPTPATSAVSLSAGEVRVSFGTAWDYDDETLTYEVLRNNNTWVNTQAVKSNFWTLPRIGFTDTGLTPGATYRYQVRITDPAGNTLWSPVSANVTVSTDTPSPYATAVRDDGAEHLWRLGETSGAAVLDYAGFDDATLNGTYTRDQSGAIGGDSDGATAFDGSSGYAVNSAAIAGPDVFSQEAWFKTTSTTGGKIVSFGDKATGTSNNYDRHTYMDPQGKVWFGVYNNGSYTVNTPNSLNDGQWHHVVGTMDATGPTLFVDGKKIGHNSGTSSAQPYNGYWRIGGDSPWNGNPYFNGTIDDVAIYPTALSLSKVQQHYTASGRTLNIPVRPSDTYGGSVWDSAPDLYWRMGEASGSTVADSSPNEFGGIYNGGTTYGTPGAVTGTANTAVTFDGTTGPVASAALVSNPTVYSQELWFKTTTTSGGKLIGFGNAQSGNSSSYDRHVYMFNDGRLRFGVWTGQANVIDTPSSYNDGTWHHMVASQGSDGMKLYVDGQLTGTNAQTQAQPYNGYWRVGGDTTWAGSSSNWFAGSVDEVAVYPSVLTANTVQQHFAAGGGNVVNEPPTASFTHTEAGLTTSVNGSASADPDGTIASYSWDFGDQTPAVTGPSPTTNHTYAAGGTFTVTLTVTDDKGVTDVSAESVTVTASPANVAPQASFTASVAELTVTLDGTGSTDADGSVTGYSWDFGDGTPADTDPTTSHTYTTAGTKTITLTVIDNEGATNSLTQQAEVVAPPPNQSPTASFTAVDSGLTVNVDGSASSDPDGTIQTYAWDFGDGGTADTEAAVHEYAAAGTYSVRLTVTDDDGASNTETQSVTVTAPPPSNVAPIAAFTSSANGLTASLNGSGSSDPDGTIAAYTWDFGDTTSDAGATVDHTYAAAGTYTIKLTVTDDDGETNTASKQLTVNAPGTPVALATDAFGRAVTNGLGTADLGGAWTLTGSSANFAVNGGSAKLRINNAGGGPSAYLNTVSAGDVNATVDVALDKAPTGSGFYGSLVTRRIGTSDYRLKVQLLPTSTRVSLSKIVNGVETVIPGSTKTVSGLTYAAGDFLRMRVQVSGMGTTKLEGKVWKVGTTEPAFQTTATDSEASLQNPGGVGLQAYLSGSSTNAPILVTVDNLSVTTIPTP